MSTNIIATIITTIMATIMATIIATVSATVTALSVFSSAAAFAPQTWSGTISDRMCGASHTRMSTKLSDRECTVACVGHGVQYALLANGQMYRLAGHEADLKAHAGHSVNVTGELKGDVIKVTNVEMPKN